MKNALLPGAKLAPFLRSLTVPSLLASAALLTGCGDDGSPATTPPPPGDATIPMSQDNNFTYTSTLDIPETMTAPQEDLQISWKDVTTDIQGHAITPADIEDVVFLQTKGMTQAQVEDWLNTGVFGPDQAKGNVYDYETGGADHANLSDFTDSGGLSPDLSTEYDVSDYTYLLEFQSGTQLGHNVRTLMFLVPTTDSSASKVNAVANSRPMLTEFQADLSTLKHLEPTVDSILDWSGVHVDGIGQTIERGDIDVVHIGFYANRDVKSLEDGFLDLEQDKDHGGPDMSWEIKVSSGTTAKLSDGKGLHGEPDFTFDTGGQDGIWLAAMFCVQACTNPAPRIVTILDPK